MNRNIKTIMTSHVHKTLVLCAINKTVDDKTASRWRNSFSSRYSLGKTNSTKLVVYVGDNLNPLECKSKNICIQGKLTENTRSNVFKEIKDHGQYNVVINEYCPIASWGVTVQTIKNVIRKCVPSGHFITLQGNMKLFLENGFKHVSTVTSSNRKTLVLLKLTMKSASKKQK